MQPSMNRSNQCLSCNAQEGAIEKSADSLVVLCSAIQKNRFLECDDAKNAFGSLYHVREPESQRLGMTFHEFLQCSQRWQTQQVYLKVQAPAPLSLLHSESILTAECDSPATVANLHVTGSVSAGCRRASWSTTAAALKPSARRQCGRSWRPPGHWAMPSRRESEVSTLSMILSGISHLKDITAMSRGGAMLQGKFRDMSFCCPPPQAGSTGCGCTACCTRKGTARCCGWSCRRGRPTGCCRRATSASTGCWPRSPVAAVSSSFRPPRWGALNPRSPDCETTDCVRPPVACHPAAGAEHHVLG